MNAEAKPRRLSLSNVSEHDQTRGTSALYDSKKTEIFARTARVDKAMGLSYRIEA